MYKIGDFSKEADIPIKTLRYYDEIDLLKPSYQDYFTGYRYYEDNQIYKIRKIKKLKELDLSLKEIKNYLETNNINILLNKERELKMKIEAIENYVNEEIYEIKEGNYDDYIKWNGLKESEKPIALELRDNVCRYYMVFKNNKYYSEVVVFPKENNLINLNITIGIKNYLNALLEYLKKDYDYLVFKSDENMYNNLDMIREKCNCIEEYKEDIKINDERTFELTNIKVSLQ